MNTVGPGNDSLATKIVSFTLLPLFGQEPKDGANASLCAATSPEVKGGEYYSPSGFLGLFGAVGAHNYPNNAKDLEVAKKLWQVSEELTKVTWNV
jgi:hypothetical protein